MAETRSTIADVARMAGVDRAVVSKVLSGDPSLRVREETRQRVVRAADARINRTDALPAGLHALRIGAAGKHMHMRLFVPADGMGV